jgi:alkylation response protein AidB-like acyl-CoA dehydrogenase
MDFAFNEEQKSLGEVVGQVLADFPGLTAPEPIEGEDAAVWTALAELGLFSLLVPEAHGGVGLTMADIGLAIEALGTGLAPPIVASTLIATDLIVQYGTQAQQDDLLPKLAAGELRLALALDEAGWTYGCDTPATQVCGNRVSGRKLQVAGAVQADYFLVLATVDGRRGLMLVSSKARGVRVEAHESIDHGASLGALVLEEASLGENSPLGHKQADEAVARFQHLGATAYAGMALGIAHRMLDTSVEYAKTRVQFGQPIGGFQAIKHRCADMAVAVEAARAAAYYAYWAVSEKSDDAARASSMAKAYCGEVAQNACNEAIQIHGGMGFTWELPLHRFLRRAKVLEHGFGGRAWHYEKVMQQMLGEGVSSSQQVPVEHDAGRAECHW